MSIEEKMQHLTDWVNGRMLINLEYRHDFIIRDVSPHAEFADPHYRLLFLCAPKGMDINHGWGKLTRPGEYQKLGIQIRKYDLPQVSFEQYLKQQG